MKDSILIGALEKIVIIIDTDAYPGPAQVRSIATKALEEYTGPTVGLQSKVNDWLFSCFGETIARDKLERNHRFLEEALELVQSLGCTKSEAMQLVEYVFSRPIGEPEQECGGVMVTLAALCLANNLDMDAAAEIELKRIWTKVDQIRDKQANKPKHSALPAATAPKKSKEEKIDAMVLEMDTAMNALYIALPEIVANDINGIWNKVKTAYASQFSSAPEVGLKTLKEVAYAAWKSAANAYRMYPDNKHTFTDYWADLGETESKKFITESAPAPSVEKESVEIENEKLWKVLKLIHSLYPKQMKQLERNLEAINAENKKSLTKEPDTK